MSGPGELHYPFESGYTSNQPFRGPLYLAHIESDTGAAFNHPTEELVGRAAHLERFHYTPLYQRSRLDSGQSGYNPLRSAYRPRVTKWEPQEGPEGTQVHITLASEVPTDPSWVFNVLFATRPCSCRLLPESDVLDHFTVAVEVPTLPASESSSGQVPLRVEVKDTAGNLVGLFHVGVFRYTDIIHQPTSSTSEASRKRKIPDVAGKSLVGRGKRSRSFHNRSYRGDSHEHTNAGYPFPQADPGITTEASIEGNIHLYQTPQIIHSQRRAARFVGSNPAITEASTVLRRTDSSRPPSWAAVIESSSRPIHSPPEPAVSNSRTSGLTSPTPMATPRLIRTSTLQSRGPSSAPTGYNPYAVYPAHKATLKIEGNLDSMTDNWGEDEDQAKRRLVQFSRSQAGGDITTTFAPVTPDERQPNSICVSCIRWDADGECYVTSVDTIYLLESLVAVRFTVEEKNRIRRNLEGFRPITISKGKADTEDFFKLIMGFPNPKPRNIEKDVKVFSWRILAHALKKIIGKYSASWASGPSTIPGPTSGGSAGGSTGDHDADDAYDSPLSTPVSAVSVAYSSDLSTSTLTPGTTHGHSLVSGYTATTAAITPGPMPASHHLTSYSTYAYAPPPPPAYGQAFGSSHAPPHQQPYISQHQMQQHFQQSRPPPWDFAAYIDPSTSVMPSGQNLYASLEHIPGASHYHSSSSSSST